MKPELVELEEEILFDEEAEEFPRPIVWLIALMVTTVLWIVVFAIGYSLWQSRDVIAELLVKAAALGGLLVGSAVVAFALAELE